MTIPWGEGGSISDPRYIQPITQKRGRRRCSCGCGQWSTHHGMANGVALASGCELSMRRWARNPADLAVRERHRPVLNERAWSTLWFASIMLDATGRFPTFDEIRRVVGLKSLAGVVRVVNGLIRAGLVARPADNDSSASITPAGRAALTKGE